MSAWGVKPRFLFITLLDSNLMVGVAEVQLSKDLGLLKLIKHRWHHGSISRFLMQGLRSRPFFPTKKNPAPGADEVKCGLALPSVRTQCSPSSLLSPAQRPITGIAGWHGTQVWGLQGCGRVNIDKVNDGICLPWGTIAVVLAILSPPPIPPIFQ